LISSLALVLLRSANNERCVVVVVVKKGFVLRLVVLFSVVTTTLLHIKFIMKFSTLAIVAALTTPVAAEIYFKEQFNDEVRWSL